MSNLRVINIWSVFLVAMVLFAVATGAEESDADEAGKGSSSAKSMCESTDYKETCEKSIGSSKSTDPKELIKAAFQATIDEIKRAITESDTVKELAKDPMSKQALDTCKKVMNTAIADLQKSFDHVGEFQVTKLNEYIENLEVWLSGAISYEQSCLDAFDNTTGEAGKKMRDILNATMELTSNGLAMVSKLSKMVSDLDLKSLSNAVDKIFGGSNEGQSRKLLSEDGLPSWMSAGQRMILQAPNGKLEPFAVVAQDGSGKFKSINEALKTVPKSSNTTYHVIHIKAGVYKEKVTVERETLNVVFIGDGATKTVITGSLNVIDGSNTYESATVGVIGDGFMAKDIGFENTAGAIKQQAVALRVESDRSVFYRCQLDAFQDTLFAQVHRQFYRDCVIAGTVDFIFGDALSLFQNCKLIVKKPNDGQGCMVTAQGRTDSREPTAIVIQNCSIVGAPDFIPHGITKAYLGRPWKEFSKTIIMQSFIDKVIDPTGWSEFKGNFALDTLYYAEFENRGPGSVQTERVKWKGIVKLDKVKAEDYTPGKFFVGDEWIVNSGVPYTPGMITGL